MGFNDLTRDRWEPQNREASKILKATENNSECFAFIADLPIK